MALQIRIRLLSVSRAVLLASCICAAWITFCGYSAFAAADTAATVAANPGLAWWIIVSLLGSLQTILIGIAVWMISNIREMFVRIGQLEANGQTLKAVCDERHKD